jgi:hypothetical protein
MSSASGGRRLDRERREPHLLDEELLENAVHHQEELARA